MSSKLHTPSPRQLSTIPVALSRDTLWSLLHQLERSRQGSLCLSLRRQAAQYAPIRAAACTSCSQQEHVRPRFKSCSKAATPIGVPTVRGTLATGFVKNPSLIGTSPDNTAGGL